MTVHAPADGLVYYGRNERGTWPGAAAMSSKLRKGGAIMADEVFITVVAPRPLVVRTAVDEKDLHQLAGRDELKGRAVPAADPEPVPAARLTSLTPVPREPGKFDVMADVELSPAAALIKPGMACTLKFTTYRAAGRAHGPRLGRLRGRGRRRHGHPRRLPAREGRQAREADRQGRQVLRRQDRDPRRAARRATRS